MSTFGKEGDEFIERMIRDHAEITAKIREVFGKKERQEIPAPETQQAPSVSESFRFMKKANKSLRQASILRPQHSNRQTSDQGLGSESYQMVATFRVQRRGQASKSLFISC